MSDIASRARHSHPPAFRPDRGQDFGRGLESPAGIRVEARVYGPLPLFRDHVSLRKELRSVPRRRGPGQHFIEYDA